MRRVRQFKKSEEQTSTPLGRQASRRGARCTHVCSASPPPASPLSDSPPPNSEESVSPPLCPTPLSSKSSMSFRASSDSRRRACSEFDCSVESSCSRVRSCALSCAAASSRSDAARRSASAHLNFSAASCDVSLSALPSASRRRSRYLHDEREGRRGGRRGEGRDAGVRGACEVSKYV